MNKSKYYYIRKALLMGMSKESIHFILQVEKDYNKKEIDKIIKQIKQKIKGGLEWNS